MCLTDRQLTTGACHFLPYKRRTASTQGCGYRRLPPFSGLEKATQNPKKGTAQMLLLVLALGSEGFTDQTSTTVQVPPLLPLYLESCDVGMQDQSELMRCWAHRMAKEMPAQYLCNVSTLPEGGASMDHPALQAKNLKDLLLPPNTHLFLYGPSHVRSVRHVLVSAAKLLGRSVESQYISVSDDCDEQPQGLTGQDMWDSPESTATCGVFQDDLTCRTGDLVRDVFESEEGSSSITLVANHRQYLVPEHTESLNNLLESADPPFTHGYFAFPHLSEYFDAHCEFRKGGAPPDPAQIGDGSEAFCDITKPTCMGTSPLYAAIRKHIPSAAFLGGVALKHNFDVDSTCSRIHDSYKDSIIEEGPAHLDPEGGPVHVHACNAICKHEPAVGDGNSPYEDTHCHAGEGVAIAWEVLRSVGLLSCPPERTCDPLEFQPLWVLGANRNQSPHGANKDALVGEYSNADCPIGERNANKLECTAAIIEAVGQGLVTGPLQALNKPNISEVPSGCSYSREGKHPVYNHAGRGTELADRPHQAIPGFPLACTFTVKHPIGVYRANASVSRTVVQSRPYQKAAATAEIAAEIAAGWRRKP